MEFRDINSKAQVWTDRQTVQWQNGLAVGKGAENKGAQNQVQYFTNNYKYLYFLQSDI